MSAYAEARWAREAYARGEIDSLELEFWERGADIEAASEAYYHDTYDDYERREEDYE